MHKSGNYKPFWEYSVVFSLVQISTFLWSFPPLKVQKYSYFGPALFFISFYSINICILLIMKYHTNSDCRTLLYTSHILFAFTLNLSTFDPNGLTIVVGVKKVHSLIVVRWGIEAQILDCVFLYVRIERLIISRCIALAAGFCNKLEFDESDFSFRFRVVESLWIIDGGVIKFFPQCNKLSIL